MNVVKIAGLRLPLYVIVLALTIANLFTHTLPNGMIGALLVLIVFGELFNLIGNHTPIIKTFLGGGAIVCIFGGAALVYYQILPQDVIKQTSTFMKSGGFLDFYIAALITGSILGMNRTLLIKASMRYVPVIFVAVALALMAVGVGGLLFGMSFQETTAYIGIPIMGGGMGAGAVPLAKVFSPTLGVEEGEMLARLVPAVALGNAMAIVAGGLLAKLGMSYPKLTGNGMLVRDADFSFDPHRGEQKSSIEIKDYVTGIIAALGFFCFGTFFASLMKMIGITIHPYAWMIIAVAVVKMLNILPSYVTVAAEKWYEFVAANFTAALMLGIGIAYTDLGMILAALSPQYIVLCALVVLGAVLGAGIAGHLMGFYFVESAITAGLCMANMGGTGDVAVLSAAKRMNLMPFAQISSRLGGAFIILLASFLVPLFFG